MGIFFNKTDHFSSPTSSSLIFKVIIDLMTKSIKKSVTKLNSERVINLEAGKFGCKGESLISLFPKGKTIPPTMKESCNAGIPESIAKINKATNTILQT